VKWGLTPEERFWHYVDKQGPNDCWNWKGRVDCGSFPKFRISKKPLRTKGAARYMWELTHGPIPVGQGIKIIKTCNNNLCVNPAHMVKGTFEWYQQKKKDRAKRIKAEYQEIKKGLRCERCGYNQHPAALQFHHKNPAEKEFILSRAMHVSVKRIRNEIAKCEVLCANCHLIHHWKERHPEEEAA
jgi:hypothetical protein